MQCSWMNYVHALTTQLTHIYNLPDRERAAFIEVDLPVSAAPTHTTMGQPEYICRQAKVS